MILKTQTIIKPSQDRLRKEAGMHHLMAKFWWILALRGILGILLAGLALGLVIWTNTQTSDVFGLFIFSKLVTIVASIIFLLGLYALFDGLFAVILGAQDYGDGRRWGALILEGVFSIALGLVTLLWPANALITVLYWIAAWAIASGLLEIKQGFDLNEYRDRRPLFLLAGICSLIFGALILFSTIRGLGLVNLIGAYAFVSGILLLIFALRLRHYTRIITVD
jgi:uncharacterized membrane protein HdeD (DUF308 family)